MWRFKTILQQCTDVRRENNFPLSTILKNRGLCRKKYNKGGCHLGYRHASSANSSFKLLLILYICTDSYSFTNDSSLSSITSSLVLFFINKPLDFSHKNSNGQLIGFCRKWQYMASEISVIRLVMGKAKELSISDLYARKR